MSMQLHTTAIGSTLKMRGRKRERQNRWARWKKVMKMSFERNTRNEAHHKCMQRRPRIQQESRWQNSSLNPNPWEKETSIREGVGGPRRWNWDGSSRDTPHDMSLEFQVVLWNYGVVMLNGFVLLTFWPFYSLVYLIKRVTWSIYNVCFMLSNKIMYIQYIFKFFGLGL